MNFLSFKYTDLNHSKLYTIANKFTAHLQTVSVVTVHMYTFSNKGY